MLSVGMTVRAVRFDCVVGRGTGAPKYVDPLWHRFQVVGVPACSVSTEVVDLLLRGNGSHEGLVRDPVDLGSAGSGGCANPYLPVASPQRPRENPAATFVLV